MRFVYLLTNASKIIFFSLFQASETVKSARALSIDQPRTQIIYFHFFKLHLLTNTLKIIYFHIFKLQKQLKVHAFFFFTNQGTQNHKCSPFQALKTVESACIIFLTTNAL